jgi:hypothetical protein
MKGIIVETIFLFALLSIVIQALLSLTSFFYYRNFQISLKSAEILKATDVVESVKRGLEFAYEYSFLQAAYEVGKLGGYESSIAQLPWRVYESTNFPSYISAIEARTGEVIKEYLNSLMSIGFKFGEAYVNISKVKLNVEEISQGATPGQIIPGQIIKLLLPTEFWKMEVWFSQPFNYSGSFFSIYDIPNRTVILPSEYFQLYEIANSLFIERDRIKEAIEKAEENMEKECKESSCTEELEKKRSNANEKFRNKILEELENAKRESEFPIEFIVNRVEIKHEIEKKDSGCLCRYFAAVDVKIDISTKNRYPVYDAEERSTKLRNIKLTFRLITSNDYEKWRPL